MCRARRNRCRQALREGSLSEWARSTRVLASRFIGRGWRLLASMDVCTIACNAIATEPTSFEATERSCCAQPRRDQVDRNGTMRWGPRGEPPRSGSRTTRRAVIEVASTALSSNLNSRSAAIYQKPFGVWFWLGAAHQRLVSARPNSGSDLTFG
jgi:hypothetical protein